MTLDFEDKSTTGRFTIKIDDDSLKGEGARRTQSDTTNTIVVNIYGDQQVVIDNVPYIFPANTVLPLVSNQHFVFEQPEHLIAWQFNREFYCIADHDHEVGCVGFLFYGIEHPLFVKLSGMDIESLSLIKNLCIADMETCDKMQGEMLRTLLKRLIINVTRIAKKQTETYHHFKDEKLDLVRRFNLLLEGNFRTEHEVQFYASALNKSPKTLSNLFSIFNCPAPSKLIQRRIVLEAKRYLHFTDMTAKEIAYALGFVSPAHFSRFFKMNTGTSVSTFKNQMV